MLAYAKFKREAGISINGLLTKAEAARNAIIAPPQPEPGAPPDQVMAFAEAAGRQGAAFFEAIGDEFLPLLIWAGLLHEDSTLTPDDVLKHCQYAEGEGYDQKFAWLLQKVLEAISLSKGITPQSPEEAAKKKRAMEELVSSLSASSTQANGSSL
jgi:hypothetical protein